MRRMESGGGGFTLLEVLVVAAIIITLAALSVSAFWVIIKGGEAGKTKFLLQQLAASAKAMKASYRVGGPIGVDAGGKPLPKAQLDDLDLGWELDPRNDLWGPGGVAAGKLVLNKRRQTFFNTTRKQVMRSPEPHLVDFFGNRIRYRLDKINGTLIERIVSFGEDGIEGTADDLEMVVDRHSGQ